MSVDVYAGMVYAGMLAISKALTRTELERLADTLSGVAADILKGEDKRGKVIYLNVTKG